MHGAYVRTYTRSYALGVQSISLRQSKRTRNTTGYFLTFAIGISGDDMSVVPMTATTHMYIRDANGRFWDPYN